MEFSEKHIHGYQTRLLIEGFLLDDRVKIEHIKEDSKIQRFYISCYFLKYLKWFIQNQDEICFIDPQMKGKILNYLFEFREINKTSSNSDKKEIFDLINECVRTCNLLDPRIDQNIYLAGQLWIRTGQFINLDGAYLCVQNSIYREKLKQSIIYDTYYFEKFMFHSPIENDEVINYNEEYALWSMNRILSDIDSFDTPSILKENCLRLIKVTNQNLLKNYVKSGLATGNRLRREKKELIKKIR